MNSIFKILPLLFLTNFALAQSKYWIFFTDKNHSNAPVLSTKTYKNRKNIGLEIYQESDLPINNLYKTTLMKSGIMPQNTSKWLNAVSAVLKPEQLNAVKKLPFVKEIIPINSEMFVCAKTTKPETFYMYYALNQMHAEAFIGNGLLADSVDIGVLDGGFFNAHKNDDLAQMFANKQIKLYRDFINPAKKDFFGEKDSNSDFHGTAVLTALGGRKADYFMGLAANANYYLARTESGKKEARFEEDNWVAAVEWLDSLGVRLVNSSLGYTTGFTNPTENHEAADMNGETTAIAKAAKIAVEQKGMILVVSAGNEGENTKWGKVVSTPADVKSVISVGANDTLGLKMPYSSVGTDFVSFTKPDITAFSDMGTSFSAPTITGFVAVLLQLNPKLKSDQIKDLLAKSGFAYPFPNNYIGYGFPDAKKCLDILTENINLKKHEILNVRTKIYSLNGTPIAIFHKKDETHVISQELPNPTMLALTKPEGVNFSTLIYTDKIIELCWEPHPRPLLRRRSKK